MLTGFVTAPGVAATAGEHLDDLSGRWVGHDVLPALIDRSDPTKFTVLWDELSKPDYRAQARAQAEQAADAARTAGPASGGAAPSPDADTDGLGTPGWAAGLIADLARQGVIPADINPVTIELPVQRIDVTAGRVSAMDAAQLMSTGEVAHAVLLSVADVPVPQEALPGPTASLCDLTLQVTRADGTTFNAVTRLGFRDAHRRSTIAVIGAALPVRIDPRDRSRVVVDSVAYDNAHPGQ